MNMIRRIFCGFLLLGILLPVAPFVYAQKDEEKVLTATVVGPADIPTGRTIILDASASRLAGTNLQYAWYVDDVPGPISTTVDAIYTPERVGELRFRLVIRANVNGEEVEDAQEHIVTVYRRKIVLIADAHVSDDDISRLRKAAASGATYLRVLRTSVSARDRGGEDALIGMLNEHNDALLDAETTILWTEGLPTPALFALMQSAQSDVKIESSVHRQLLLLPTEFGLHTIARTVQGPVKALEPRRIFVVRPSLLAMLMQSENDEVFLQQARDVPADVMLLQDVTGVTIPWWSFLANLINSMMGLGISSQTIVLLLVLPVIATILSFLKQIVGMTTFGLFTPAIIALSFLVLGWAVGVFFLLFILMTGYASRAMMRRLHILYIPKMAIILAIGSVTLLILVGIGTLFGIRLTADTVFVLLIMSTLVESFLNVKSEQGLRSAILAIGQTIVAALLCIWVVQWAPFQAFIVAYPEMLFLTILINILLGRFTGLRITEYVRFREVFKYIVQEE